MDVFLGWFGPASRADAASVGSGVGARPSVPGVHGALDAVARPLVKGSTGGPDAAAREEHARSCSPRPATPAGTVLAEARLEGVNGYDVTAASWPGARRPPRAGGLQGTGALGPVDGFGLDALQAGCAEAGITRVV